MWTPEGVFSISHSEFRILNSALSMVSVAQLVRALDCGSRG